ncbi:uncharacterized protein bdg [Chelonus insularis]|uniref:uncharacterized protein bdg n=1 Tax=Chelonus insularis TaxID=460826 RepID=UPI00158ED18C|nr:uncharacterized protein LOC118070245 [Chelonus insularis]XP_034944633.1 uncharacterized protein LOC118070245 [Chelonus insularis]XP_034944639.1 uncharacterized protein LOC118070245 [Chelonus insularis]
MATAIAEDEDLIDLDGRACVSTIVVPEINSEEQEHLLDVCPPKLEQKLSLTREHKLIREHCDNGDVLVTLGHDQVVPVRKRIDVVSSETIKRIRDITKNLEPVITASQHSDNVESAIKCNRNRVDGSRTPQEYFQSSDDLTFEAQAIRAFDFLSELDDIDDDNLEEKIDDREVNKESQDLNESITSEKPLIVSYPLEPTCLIQISPNKFQEVDKNIKNRENYEKQQVVYSKCNEEIIKNSRDNPCFDASSSLRKQWLVSAAIERTKSVNFDTQSQYTSTTGQLKKSGKKLDSKSWSEGFEKTSSIVDYCQPSTSAGITATYKSICSIGQSEIPSASSSECSEVDWSWVEELERQRSSTSRPKLSTSEYAPTTAVTGTSSSNARLAFSTSEPKGPSMRSLRPSDRLSNGSVAMSVDVTGKPVASTLSQNDFNHSDDTSTTTTTFETASMHSEGTSHSTNCDSNNAVVNSPASSWMRSSMRRLRHLRLPEAQRTRRSSANIESDSLRPVSAPNSLPDIALIAPEVLAAHTNSSNSETVLRPSSAPVVRTVDNTSSPGIITPRRGRRNGRSRTNNRAERFSCQRNISRSSSRDNSVSCVGGNSDGAVESNVARRINNSTQHSNNSTSNTRRVGNRQTGETDRENERGEDEDDDENPLGKWPHALSPALACLGCTLGLFNISRFAILSVQFGANFIVQFLVLSLVLGIPLLTFHVCLGQRLSAGAVDMWRISPVFHGVGIALLVAHAFIGIYSIIGVSWMFVYFRDSFITKQDKYRWAEPFSLFRDDNKPNNYSTSYKLHETVPDYFSGIVLQRHHLNEPDPGVVTLKFQVAFNLAVVWMIVFVSLSKGLRSYGKVVYVFTLVPVFGTLILCTKLLGLTPPGTINQLFPATVWAEFFINSKSWVAAASEVFLTWGILGAATMQIAAHNKHKHLLQRDTSLVIVLTIVVLLLAAFLANTCVQILRHHGYIYTTSSFEKISGYTFMRPTNQAPPAGYSNTVERYMSHVSFLLGERAIKPGADPSIESGYQALRLSTELVPATLALLGAEHVSPFWAVLFYFILILFGIAQQLAIWHCVITGIMAINAKMMKLWETTITFFSCACAYILGLPMATELGIYVVYYLDYTVGGAWWIIVLYLVQVGAVFAVRGRPHTGEAVVAELFPPTGRCLRHWAGPLLSFTWNVILPITLMVLSITLFRTSGFRELYNYRRTNRDYWAIWAKQLGASIQLIPILIIPAVAIIQTCRYLNNGPPDIFDRIQLLYRPNLEPENPQRTQAQLRNNTSTNVHSNGILPTTSDVPFEDPPPKYTPPPSYTTATGARIAKMLRQSFRRSVRRIASVLGESSVPRTRPALQPPPPDYAAVLVEMNQSILSRDITVHTIEPRPDVTDVGISMNERLRPNTLDRMTRINTLDRCPVARTHSTIDRNRRSQNSGSSNLTAADVANLLRSSIRRGTARTQQNLRRNSLHNLPPTAASIENLVSAAAPISEDSLVFAKNVPLVPEQDNDDNDDEDKKTVEMDNSVSVI